MQAKPPHTYCQAQSERVANAPWTWPGRPPTSSTRVWCWVDSGEGVCVGLREKKDLTEPDSTPGTEAEGRGMDTELQRGADASPVAPVPLGVPCSGWPSSDATNALPRNKEGRAAKHTGHLEPRCGGAGGQAGRSDPWGRRPGLRSRKSRSRCETGDMMEEGGPVGFGGLRPHGDPPTTARNHTVGRVCVKGPRWGPGRPRCLLALCQSPELRGPHCPRGGTRGSFGILSAEPVGEWPPRSSRVPGVLGEPSGNLFPLRLHGDQESHGFALGGHPATSGPLLLVEGGSELLPCI